MEDEININDQYRKFFKDNSLETSIMVGTETKFKKIPSHWLLICSCEIPKTEKKQLLVFIDKHFYIFEDSSASEDHKLRLIFRRYFADIISYTDRSDPRVLHISSKIGKKNVKFYFKKASKTIESKKLLQEKSKVMVLKELQFIKTMISKFEADCL
jgi:molybdopterin-guanine dinucleotide biosynthesis protein A